MFDDKFDCLLSPVKYLLGNFNSNVGVGGAGFGDVPLEDRSGSVDRDPVGVDRERVEVEKALRAGVPGEARSGCSDSVLWAKRLTFNICLPIT